MAAYLGEAEVELGLAEPDAPQEGLPPSLDDTAAVLENNAPTVDEQPDGDEVENPLDLLAQEASQPTQVSSDDPAFWNIEVDVEIDGERKRVSLDDLRKGSMMRADYTRKTQEVARERELLSEAADIHKALREDPAGFAKYLAVKAGLIDGEAEAPSGVRVYTEDEIEAQVTERLEKAIADHPDIQTARQEQALVEIDRAFERLEQKWDTKLKNEHRILVLTEAKRRGTTDLELVLDSLMLRATQIANARTQARKSAPTRPGAASPTEVTTPPRKVASMQDAWDQALEEMQESVA